LCPDAGVSISVGAGIAAYAMGEIDDVPSATALEKRALRLMVSKDRAMESGRQGQGNHPCKNCSRKWHVPLQSRSVSFVATTGESYLVRRKRVLKEKIRREYGLPVGTHSFVLFWEVVCRVYFIFRRKVGMTRLTATTRFCFPKTICWRAASTSSSSPRRRPCRVMQYNQNLISHVLVVRRLCANRARRLCKRMVSLAYCNV